MSCARQHSPGQLEEAAHIPQRVQRRLFGIHASGDAAETGVNFHQATQSGEGQQCR